ncbi:hypothetical protein SAMN05421594_3368 [Chryseobacterium oleae]|uniref:Uncharacterized protein n=1 Tax=Chryseobacterium oleae TaxID=491207 RepID=A0A1I5A6F2_CHROL|nr:hypothetical protein [Chryseobacterium oleae]SFN58014.1 hypothetical protein SAMN05421594_3368 [Chryseobacterium oleae]
MSNLSWYPISPTLTDKGNFSAFAYEDNAKSLKPIPLDEGTDPFSQFRVIQNSLSVQTAANLGIGVSSISGNYSAFVLSYEAMVFTEKIIETPIGGKIYGTRWGAGLRVVLKISEIKSNANFNFGAIAASAELGLAKVEYEINGIGISKPDILSVLPGPGDFNFSNYKKILDAVDVVKKFMAEHASELQPKPFQVFISDDSHKDVFTDSKAILFSMRSIASRDTMKTAITNAKNRFNISTIKAAYAKFLILDENTEPTREQKRMAEEFLNT